MRVGGKWKNGHGGVWEAIKDRQLKEGKKGKKEIKKRERERVWEGEDMDMVHTSSLSSIDGDDFAMSCSGETG